MLALAGLSSGAHARPGSSKSAPVTSKGLVLSAEAAAAVYRDAYRRPQNTPAPPDNAITPARVDLGRALFFDPRLSGSGAMSCGTCHNPSLSWGDGLPRAVGAGMQTLGRRTPTVLDTAWATALFWDGRATTLEEQALGPIAAAGEMNLPLDTMEAKIQTIQGYSPLFAAAYPGESVDRKTVAKAIATFERTVVSGKAPFDRWVDGDTAAISDDAKEGFLVFNTTGGCSSCHSGWRFTDDSFYDVGVSGEDIGRGTVLPGIAMVEHAFKTPTLRDVNRRFPYMHDGSEASLVSVMDLYNVGGRVRRETTASQVRPLGLSAEDKEDLVAFLDTLTSEASPAVMPTLPR